MGTLIQPGQLLVAGQAEGELNQYYGYADSNASTVTSSTYGNLSTQYTIPAGEAYAGAGYELACGGTGTWGSTQQTMTFQAIVGTSVLTMAIAAAALSASAGFYWRTLLELECADGVSGWWATFSGSISVSGAPLNPGTAADQAIALAAANSSVHTASVSSAISVALQAKWASTTGAPTISNYRTSFKKVA